MKSLYILWQGCHAFQQIIKENNHWLLGKQRESLPLPDYWSLSIPGVCPGIRSPNWIHMEQHKHPGPVSSDCGTAQPDNIIISLMINCVHTVCLAYYQKCAVYRNCSHTDAEVLALVVEKTQMSLYYKVPK